MAKRFPAFEQPHLDFIAQQHIYFTATAAPTGRVNLSPKGMDSLKVLGPNRLIWLNYTGSGNESAGHLLEDPRMTVMWCSFETRPLILRAYGTASVVYKGQPGWDDLASHFDVGTGARQIFDLTVDLVQTSCGYAVPKMEFTEDRDTLSKWADGKGEDGIRAYWDEKNRETLDGATTGIEEFL